MGSVWTLRTIEDIAIDGQKTSTEVGIATVIVTIVTDVEVEAEAEAEVATTTTRAGRVIKVVLSPAARHHNSVNVFASNDNAAFSNVVGQRALGFKLSSWAFCGAQRWLHHR